MTCNCTKFVIFRNYPLPTRRRTYPYAQLEVGDSVHIPEAYAPYPTASSAAHQFGLRTCRKFTIRSECYRGKPGIRVWRTA